jgi:peptidoglycan/xylan/chitin deacetylase (PgdA/CDA1 family)
VVAFTFDAGSDAGYTVQILDALAANGITASFGVTGAWIERYPDLLKRIASDGHSLINHSYDHASFTGRSTGVAPLSRSERWEQLNRTENLVHDLAGASTKPYFRPPYGDFDASVNEDVGAGGYTYNVMWNADSRGWTGIAATEIARLCLSLAAPGTIYVFHVGSASQDGPALQAVIDGLRDAGYSIGDLDAVLAP